MDPTSLAFFTAGLTIILGFIGSEFFKKTGIPDVAFLLLFGVFLGPVFHIFNRDALLPILPYFAALALIFILFDGGLNMDMRKVIRESPRASMLALSGFILSLLLITFICKFLLGWRFINGLLLGSILGGSCSTTVILIVRRIGITEKTATILGLESALTDVFCTVSAFAIINVILSGIVDLEVALRSVATAFAVGAILGLILGATWLLVLDRLHGKPNAYMLTLALLLISFMIARTLGGTGALSALFLGLVLGNGPYFSRVLELKTTLSVDENMRTFHAEISFLIRAFFYVFIGLLVGLTSVTLILLGIGLSILLLVVRAVAVNISTIKMPKLKEKAIMIIMLPRGLAAAVLASLPMAYGITGSDVFPEITFAVILTTVIICTVGIAISPTAHMLFRVKENKKAH